MTGHDLDRALSEARAIAASDCSMMLRRCYKGDDPERAVYAETALDLLPALVAEVESLRTKLAAAEDERDKARCTADAMTDLYKATTGKLAAAEQERDLARETGEMYWRDNQRFTTAFAAVREWATGNYGGTKRPIDIWPGLATALAAAEQGEPKREQS